MAARLTLLLPRLAVLVVIWLLEDDGFGWRVEGDVDGYAANTVAVQNPAPGVRVVENGAPAVVLRLDRSTEYDERGLPENASPYKGTPVVLLEDWRAAAGKPAPKPKPKPAAAKPK